MTARQELTREEFTLVDSEGRRVGVILDGITFHLEWDEDNGWEPMAATWCVVRDRRFWDVWGASCHDDDNATWNLLMSSWAAAKLDDVACQIEAPTNEVA